MDPSQKERNFLSGNLRYVVDHEAWLILTFANRGCDLDSDADDTNQTMYIPKIRFKLIQKIWLIFSARIVWKQTIFC